MRQTNFILAWDSEVWISEDGGQSVEHTHTHTHTHTNPLMPQSSVKVKSKDLAFCN